MGCLFFILISANLPLSTFLPLQGGGQEGDGCFRLKTHPHPNPPLEGEGVIMPQDKNSAKQVFKFPVSLVPYLSKFARHHNLQF